MNELKSRAGIIVLSFEDEIELLDVSGGWGFVEVTAAVFSSGIVWKSWNAICLNYMTYYAPNTADNRRRVRQFIAAQVNENTEIFFELVISGLMGIVSLPRMWYNAFNTALANVRRGANEPAAVMEGIPM